MKHQISSVVAGSPGWQQECWALAKAGKEFTVLELSETNLPFIEALSIAYQYKNVTKRKKISFVLETASPSPATGAESRAPKEIVPAPESELFAKWAWVLKLGGT